MANVNEHGVEVFEPGQHPRALRAAREAEAAQKAVLEAEEAAAEEPQKSKSKAKREKVQKEATEEAEPVAGEHMAGTADQGNAAEEPQE